MQDSNLLSLRGISKAYSGTPVFEDINLDFYGGEVAVLLGENGAGKTTLKNIIRGLVEPDNGRIFFRGVEQASWSERTASEAGVSAIHQELSLFPNLTVAENLFIRNSSDRFASRVDFQAIIRDANLAFKDILGMNLDCSRKVESLSLGQRQLVEIVKAVLSSSAVLVLDEPTTSLSLEDRGHLYKAVKKLREKGLAIIHVTHFLEEVAELADRVIIMRDGVLVADERNPAMPREQIELFMVGREIKRDGRDRRAFVKGNSVLQVKELRDSHTLRGISLEVKEGEILGLAGLTGAGRTETLSSIFGVTPSTGEVVVGGVPYIKRSVRRSKAAGIGMVSEDRRLEQAFLQRPLFENLFSASISAHTRFRFFIGRRSERNAARDILKSSGTKFFSEVDEIGSLSGGNQQKIILERWVFRNPRILLLDEPTKGIDVGARENIQKKIFELAARGVAILVASSDSNELIQLSDRILVLRDGKIQDELLPDRFDVATILSAASGTAKENLSRSDGSREN